MHVCVDLVTAANDECQNGRKFMCGWSTGERLQLYRTERLQAYMTSAEPVACKWRVKVAHLVLVLHDACPNTERDTRTGEWNPTRKPHIPTLQLHNVHQLIRHDKDGWMRPNCFQPVLLTHKISGTGPTQIQDNHKKDHSIVRELSLDVVLGSLEEFNVTSFKTHTAA